MKYPRAELLQALNMVRPALAAKDLIEELSHVWFDGATITAYNDADLGIQVPFKTDFKGGVRGALLLGLLNASKAKEVELETTDDNHLKLVASRTRGKLAVLDSERSVWQFPEFDPKDGVKINEDFLRVLQAVLVSVGNDTSTPEKLGVTLVAEKTAVRMYSTDSKSVACVVAEAPKGKWFKPGLRVILPTAFCEQLLRLCSGGGSMHIAQDSVVAANPQGVMLYARLVDVQRPLDFVATFNQHADLKDGVAFDVPPKLALALERAMVILEGVVGESVEISTAAGKLRLEAHVEGRANVKDYITLPEGVPEVLLRVDPSLVKRALPYATQIAITEGAVVLLGEDDFIYLASASGG